jgi:hypothetical protein
VEHRVAVGHQRREVGAREVLVDEREGVVLARGKLRATDGSWEAGINGAQPGVIMPTGPRLGLAYREEYAEGVAEDRGEVSSLGERVEVPSGSDRSALRITETEGIERALYARDVGPVLGIKVSGGGGREELIGFQKGSTSRRR